VFITEIQCTQKYTIGNLLHSISDLILSPPNSFEKILNNNLRYLSISSFEYVHLNINLNLSGIAFAVLCREVFNTPVKYTSLISTNYLTGQTELVKGKPLERVGRKATGLNP
jgi:hypothetical protein